jgi:hypothetical protein
MKRIVVMLLLAFAACTAAGEGRVCYRTVEAGFEDAQMLAQVPCTEPHIGDGQTR